MLEFIQEAVFSRNVIALIIIALMAIVLVKIIYNTGKITLLLAAFAILGAALYFFFPDFLQTIIERIQTTRI